MKTIITDTGTTIYVGKNSKENDYITFELAKKEYLWFHANNIPGAHVILNNNISQNDIQEAANLAAFHSKDKLKKYVDIIYCPIENISKPKYAPAGLVLIDNLKDSKIIKGYPYLVNQKK